MSEKGKKKKNISLVTPVSSKWIEMYKDTILNLSYNNKAGQNMTQNLI